MGFRILQYIIWFKNKTIKQLLLFQAEKEAREAEKSREELGLGEGADQLKALIQVRFGS